MPTTTDEFVSKGLNTRPTFFGCDIPANTTDAPLIIYVANGGAPLGQAPGGGYADGAVQPPTRNLGPQDMVDLPDPRAGDPAVPPVRSAGSVPAAPGRGVPARANDPLPPSARADCADCGMRVRAQDMEGHLYLHHGFPHHRGHQARWERAIGNRI